MIFMSTLKILKVNSLTYQRKYDINFIMLKRFNLEVTLKFGGKVETIYFINNYTLSDYINNFHKKRT